MKRPVAYLRKSKVTSDRHVSWEVQEGDIRELAARHNDNGDKLLVLSDWSKSGREGKTRARPDYLRLKAMVAADQVSALYGYSMSRLARSLREYVALAELCQEHNVPIRLAKEGTLDYSTVQGRLQIHILAAVAQAEAEWGAERSADAVRIRRERGDVLGIAPYGSKRVNGRLVPNPAEPIEPIIEAFERAGSCFGAARLLNAAGSRTRRGAHWTSKVVADILEREGVAYRRRPNPGAKPRADWITYRLLVCHCGYLMTAMDKRSPRVTCWRARHVPDHPRPFGIAESKLLPAIRAEVAHLSPPSEVEVPGADIERREGLHRRRERVLDLYETGLVDKADRDRRLSLISDELELLDAESKMVELPGEIDWTLPPRELNEGLRLIFERIELGPDLMPARFAWRVPEWRAA